MVVGHPFWIVVVLQYLTQCLPNRGLRIAIVSNLELNERALFSNPKGNIDVPSLYVAFDAITTIRLQVEQIQLVANIA